MKRLKRPSVATGAIVLALAFWPSATQSGQFADGMDRLYDPSVHCTIAVHLKSDPPGYFSC